MSKPVEMKQVLVKESLKPKKEYTLAFIVNEDKAEVLLGLKKRGFGQGFWNGFGGKIEVGEQVSSAAAREVKEECGLDVELSEELAQIRFEFVGDAGQILETHVFKTSVFSGVVTESEEMLPKWWPIEDVPYNQMWPDSKIWYNRLFSGMKFTAFFLFDDSNEIKEFVLTDQDGFEGLEGVEVSGVRSLK